MLAFISFSQKTDSTQSTSHFSGTVNITNNGISIIPTFTLGKPAAIFNFSAGSKKLSFDPELKFSLSGKPWGFVFWLRCKLASTNKWNISVSAHPAFTFHTETVSENGTSKDIFVARRYVAAELSPNYSLSKNTSIGMYCLYGHGLQNEGPQNTYFFTVNSNFSAININSRYYMKFTPQFYYLKIDKEDGFYFTSALTLAKKNFPLSVSSIINQKINSNISGSKNFVWNASLVYTFNKQYVKP